MELYFWRIIEWLINVEKFLGGEWCVLVVLVRVKNDSSVQTEQAIDIWLTQEPFDTNNEGGKQKYRDDIASKNDLLIDITFWATPCDNRVDCHEAEDEKDCSTKLKALYIIMFLFLFVLIYVLGRIKRNIALEY